MRGSGLLAFEMPAEALAHCAADLVGEESLAAAREALEERGRENVRRHAEVDRCLHRPPAFTAVAHAAGEGVEVGVTGHGLSSQIKKPTWNDGAAPPELGDVSEVKVVSVVRGIA